MSDKYPAIANPIHWTPATRLTFLDPIDPRVREVLEYVSRGRRYVDVEPYPDAEARAALGALADEDVLALPPEPEAGTAAVIRAGTYAGRTYDCVSGDGGGDEYASLWVGRRFGACVAWSDLLRMAGPQGVRIVRDGDT